MTKRPPGRSPQYDRILIYLLVVATAALATTIVVVTGTTAGLTDLASFMLSVSAVAATLATCADSRHRGKQRDSPPEQRGQPGGR